MAECLFNHYAQQLGLPQGGISAGVYAQEGQPASEGACAAMKARGLSLSSHRAQPLEERLLQEVVLIVAMTQRHAALCRERFPGLAVPVRVFSPPIPDPFGGTAQDYCQTADALAAQVQALAESLAEKGQVPPDGVES